MGLNSRSETFRLIAATHTPFGRDGALQLSAVPLQARHLAASGVWGVFVAGSTGEAHSLTVEERLLLAERWAQAGPEAGLRVIVHVGHNCQLDAQRLAAQAADLGVDAVALQAPFYFRPATVADLVDFCAPIASAAGQVPCYYYDIPSLTGVALSMVEFLERGADRMPNLKGLKYTNGDMAQLQECLRLGGGAFDILSGFDEVLLATRQLGVSGAVGSTYNFAAPLYLRMLAALEEGDLREARTLQAQALELIRLLQQFGFLPASKVLLAWQGVDCGPCRPPLRGLSERQLAELRQRLAQTQGMIALESGGRRL